MKESVRNKIEESYRRIKPYLNDPEEVGDLYKMCSKCEYWDANNMSYEKCKDKPCFQFWLAYEYLNWEASFE